MLAAYIGLQDSPIAPGEACTLDPYFPPADTQDPYWANVVLLLEMNGADGGTTFTDSSPLARTPATVSNVETSTDNFKYGTASAFPNAASPVLEYAADSDFNFDGGSVWTVEFWLYTTSIATQQQFLGQRTGTGRFFRIETDADILWIDEDGTNIAMGDVRVNAWSHFALTCDGTTIRSYNNGSRVQSQTASNYDDTTVTDFCIVSASANWASQYLRGYLDGVRITQGTARYTTDGFTIPPAAYPASLETTFGAGDPRTLTLLQFEPPEPTVIFSAPGTTDATDTTSYLGETATPSVTDATAVSYGAGGFTFVSDATNNRITYSASSKLRAWLYRESRMRCTVTVSGTPSGAGGADIMVWGHTIASPSFGWAVSVSGGLDVSLTCVAYDTSGNNTTGVSGLTLPFTAELELRLTENGIFEWYVDGVIVRTYVSHFVNVPPAQVAIGPRNVGAGGISQIQVANARIELTDLMDRAAYQTKYTRQTGNGELSSAQSRFGTHSLYAPAGGSGAWFTDWHQDFLMGTEDWTVECWAYRESNAAVGTLGTLPGSTSFKFSVGTDGLIDVVFVSASGTTTVNNITTFPLATWTHVVIQRRAGDYEVLMAGALINTTAVPGGAGADQGTTAALYIGRESAGVGWGGYVDEYRVTRGIARYSDGYTPPTSPFCTYGGDATPPDTTPQPIPIEPIAFGAVTRASLFGIVGSAISSTTLATITCADDGMTTVLSEPVAGLTFDYTSKVLSASGTPTGPTKLHRVVVSYIASDGSNTVRGSTTHEITIVDASEVLTIGSMAGAAGRVGIPLTATLASPSTNYEVAVTIAPGGIVPGLAPSLAWTIGSGSASGTLSIAGTPATAGTYSLDIDFYGYGQLLGTSTHEIVIAAAYRPAPPAPSPSPAPPAPSPTPPPAPTPAPAPGVAADPYFSSVKVLMHFDAATGLTTDVKGGSFTNYGVTSGTGAVAQAGVFTSAATRIEGQVAGIDGADGALSVEALVDLDSAAWSALVDGSLTDNRFCPVATLIDAGGEVVWTIGFASTKQRTGPPGRYVLPTMFNALTGYQFGYPVGSRCAVTHAYPDLQNRPARFVHLAMTRRANPVAPTDESYDQGTWFDGAAGGQRRVPYLSLLKTAATGTLRIGGVCPRIEYVIASIMQRDVTIVPFSGAIDELRITAYPRYVSFLFPGLLGLGQQASAIPPYARVIPWPNY